MSEELKVQRYEWPGAFGGMLKTGVGNWVSYGDYKAIEKKAKTLVDAIREEGGWGEDVMDAMETISPESFVPAKFLPVKSDTGGDI